MIETTLQNLQLLQTFHDSPAPAPVLSLQRAGGGGGLLQLQILWEPGLNYTLQSSTNLVNWQVAQLYVPEGTTIQTNTVGRALFFRATPAPTPP
jgi:hypothetical protein